MLTVKYSNLFKKDYKLAMKRHMNIDLLDDVIRQIADGKELDKKFKDHELSGNWKGHRECHIQPDWLLIYETTNTEVRLARLGSHSDLLFR